MNDSNLLLTRKYCRLEHCINEVAWLLILVYGLGKKPELILVGVGSVLYVAFIQVLVEYQLSCHQIILADHFKLISVVNTFLDKFCLVKASYLNQY